MAMINIMIFNLNAKDSSNNEITFENKFRRKRYIY